MSFGTRCLFLGKPGPARDMPWLALVGCWPFGIHHRERWNIWWWPMTTGDLAGLFNEWQRNQRQIEQLTECHRGFERCWKTDCDLLIDPDLSKVSNVSWFDFFGFPSFVKISLHQVVVSNIFFYPKKTWGRIPIWRSYFFRWVVQPPTSACFLII